MLRKVASAVFILLLCSSAFMSQAVKTDIETLLCDDSLSAIDWVHYHSYAEIVAILFALNESYPNIVDVFSVGKSWQNRDIYCVCLTNESNIRAKPAVLFNGYHHANEAITAELTLYFVVYVAENYQTNTTVSELLNRCEIYVVVALNVDGFDLFAMNDQQRKNARPLDEDSDGRVDEDPPTDENGDGFIEQLYNMTDPSKPVIQIEGNDTDNDGNLDWAGGVDLNRNYDFHWGEQIGPTIHFLNSSQYEGPAPFSEPETQAMNNLVLKHNFTYGLDFHSGKERIYYPRGYNGTKKGGDLIEVAEDLSRLTGGTTVESDPPPYGAWDDWMCGNKSVIALTCEIFTNGTFNVEAPGSYPNTTWRGWYRYRYNPFPSAVQSVVAGWLPVFFCISGKAKEAKEHDVSVVDANPYRTVFGRYSNTSMNVTVANEGCAQETFNVTLCANSTAVQTKQISLPTGTSTDVTFKWNFTLPLGNYNIKGVAEAVKNETILDDNEFLYGVVQVSILGDINADGQVNILDVTMPARAFGTRPGDKRWNANADMDENGVINIIDVSAIAKEYGKSV